jgi:hypothetical protein
MGGVSLDSGRQVDSRVFFLSKFILQSVVIHLAELSVRLQWLGERHSVEPLRKY